MQSLFEHNQFRNFTADPSSWRVLVVGAGKSGQAVLRFLSRLGARLTLSDAAPASAMDDDFFSWLRKKKIIREHGGHDLSTFLGADLIIVSPGVPLDIPCLEKARQAEIPIIGELGFASLFLDLPTIAVTGTNGKTTVTSMLATLFRVAGKNVFVGGNIGRPLSEYLLEVGDNGQSSEELAILEISSYQIETAGQFRPDIGILLNISPDHLDRYSSYEAYVAAKFALFANQDKSDKALFNLADPLITEKISTLSGQGEKFYWGDKLSGKKGATLQGGEVLVSLNGDIERYSLPEQLKKSPNCENAQAAILAARLAGCPKEAIEKGLSSFKPSPHRIARIAEIDGVVFYDDSKATNIGAVQSALASMDRPVILIAGGRDKGGDYNLLVPLLREKVKTLFLIGEAREKMAEALAKTVDVRMAGDLREAVTGAMEHAKPGDAVLLSPACSSFDMYSSYAERGRHFEDLVNNLLKS